MSDNPKNDKALRKEMEKLVKLQRELGDEKGESLARALFATTHPEPKEPA